MTSIFFPYFQVLMLLIQGFLMFGMQRYYVDIQCHH